jgi:ethanolamine utilization protein EutQ
MIAGIMELKDTPLHWETKSDEIKYVLEGVLELVINNKKYIGKQGDMLYIPANTKVIFFLLRSKQSFSIL